MTSALLNLSFTKPKNLSCACNFLLKKRAEEKKSVCRRKEKENKPHHFAYSSSKCSDCEVTCRCVTCNSGILVPWLFSLCWNAPWYPHNLQTTSPRVSFPCMDHPEACRKPAPPESERAPWFSTLGAHIWTSTCPSFSQLSVGKLECNSREENVSFKLAVLSTLFATSKIL